MVVEQDKLGHYHIEAVDNSVELDNTEVLVDT